MGFFNNDDLAKIKSRMLNVKLTRDIRRNLRTLDYLSKYKALEYKILILFIIICCTYDILPRDKFNSVLYFIQSLYVLLQDEINLSDLTDCDYNFLKFAGECEILYGTDFMTYNIHSTSHYCNSVRLCGPMWANSAFAFETGIYHFIREMNAPNSCLNQITEKWLRSSMLQNYLANSKDDTIVVQYCKSLFVRKEPLQKSSTIDKTTFIGASTHNNAIQSLIQEFTREQIKIFNRCIHKSLFFHTVQYNRCLRIDDSVVQITTDEIIQIHYLAITADEKGYICGCKWTVSNTDFHENVEPAVVKHLFQVLDKTGPLTVIDINMIKRKALVIDIREKLFRLFLPNMYETH